MPSVVIDLDDDDVFVLVSVNAGSHEVPIESILARP